MSWAIEEMLNIVWCPAAAGADVEANILTDSALVGAEESTVSGSKLGEGRAFSFFTSRKMAHLFVLNWARAGRFVPGRVVSV